MQLILLRLSLHKHYNGLWFPHPKQYLDNELIYISGSGVARSIRSLIAHGYAEAAPNLHAYAFQITDKGRAAVETALKNAPPMAAVSSPG